MADRDRFRRLSNEGDADRGRLDRLQEPPGDPGRPYLGVVTGLGAGVRVQGPKVVQTHPIPRLTGPESAGSNVLLEYDLTRIVLVDLIGGFASDGDNLLAVQVDGRWVARRVGSNSTDPCPDRKNTLCVHVYSWRAWCDWWNAWLAAPGPTPPPFPDLNLPGIPVVIQRTPFNPSPLGGPGTTDWTAVASGNTDSAGLFCVDLLPTVANPVAPPTVEPNGGGATGGPLPANSYTILYNLKTHFGVTLASPPSLPFQLGVPDPQAYPIQPAATVNPTGGGPPGGGGLLAAGDYFAAYSYRDGSTPARRTRLSAPSGVFTVPAGAIPRVTLPPLADRPNATGFDVFLCDAEAGHPSGDWHRNNAAPVTTSSYDAANSFDPDTQAIPNGVNNTVTGKPRVTIPGLGSNSAELFVAGPAGTGPHYAETATSSPWVLTHAPGPIAPNPSPINTTGFGYFRATTTVGDCPVRYEGVAINSGQCVTYTIHQGFCCFKYCIDSVTDGDDGSDLDPVQWITIAGGPPEDPNLIPTPPSCYNPTTFVTTAPGCTPVLDTCSTGVPSPTQRPMAQGPVLNLMEPGTAGPISCPGDVNLSTGQPIGTADYTLRKEGYFDGCVRIAIDCGVPTRRNPSASARMWRKDRYLDYRCCGGCDPRNPTARPRNLLKRHLQATFNGPPETFGIWNGVPIDLFWDPTSYSGLDPEDWWRCAGNPLIGLPANCFIRFDSGCLGQGFPGRGACYKIGTCHTGECGTFGEFVFDSTYFVRDVPFQSARVRLYLPVGFDMFAPPGSDNDACPAYWIQFDNYWAPGCPDVDPPPVCNPDYPDTHPWKYARMPILCERHCNCPGTSPPDKTWMADELPAKSWSVGRDFYTARRGTICAPTNLFLEYWASYGVPCVYGTLNPKANVTITEVP